MYTYVCIYIYIYIYNNNNNDNNNNYYVKAVSREGAQGPSLLFGGYNIVGIVIE